MAESRIGAQCLARYVSPQSFVSAGRRRRIDRLPHGRSLLASSSISRWQLGPQRGGEKYLADYQCCRPVALECQIGSDALPPPAAPGANRPAALMPGKLEEAFNLFLTFNRYGSERGRVSLMTNLDDVLNFTRNAKAG